MSLWFDRLMFPHALWLVLPALLLLVESALLVRQGR